MYLLTSTDKWTANGIKWGKILTFYGDVEVSDKMTCEFDEIIYSLKLVRPFKRNSNEVICDSYTMEPL